MNRRQFVKSTLAGSALLSSSWVARAQHSKEYGGPRPTAPQLAWQEAELGLLYCYELHVFDPERYVQRNHRRKKLDMGLFNPTKLDTDQWMESAVGAGAKFAILTASHESGFRLWQSDANPFSLKNTKWGNGKRDIVEEFVNSCHKFGIKPGIYMGTRWNAHLKVHDFRVNWGKGKPESEQLAYSQLIEAETKEICSRYGDLFELWYDGGAYTPDKGGPDVLSIFEKYQPNCLFYHNEQRADARWGGTESGTVQYPCWATFPSEAWVSKRNVPGYYQLLKHGDPRGDWWCPAMSDAPLRNHEWFWEPNDQHKIYSLDALMNMYYKSVGRNSTLILGATPDTDGLMPKADTERFKEFGDTIRQSFENPLASTRGTGDEITLDLPSPQKIDTVVIQEEIAHGERTRRYDLEGWVASDKWVKLGEGTCIGHKRIQEIAPIVVSGVRLRIGRSLAEPLIKSLTVYHVG